MTTNEDVLKKLPNDAVRAALLDIIKNNVPSKDYSIHMENGSVKGDNYIGVVHRLSIMYKEDDQNDDCKQKKLGIFLKVPPENLIRRQQFFARPCFLRESLIYDEYLPLLLDFQKSKGILPEETGFKEYARSYRCITGDLEEAVFMEDLSLEGFKMNDRFTSASADLVKVVMRALGKFHALSFALKDQWSDKFAKFKELEEIFIQKNEDDLFINYLNSLSEMGFNTLSKDGDEENLEKLNAFLKRGTLFSHMSELVQGSKAEPYAVVCHGDCWSNNILFKYKAGMPVEAKLIDWQIARFASPVCDLMYYLFGCTTKPMRDEHYENLLDVYYSELSTFLERLGSDPTVLFPRTAFDDQLKEFGAFGLVMGLMIIPTITSKGDDIPDLDLLSAKMEEGDVEYTKQILQKGAQAAYSRIRDVIVDIIRLGYI